MSPSGHLETACVFKCGDETLVGVASLPDGAPSLGVVIVVGGPQYRAGSHRQFVLLARHLAHSGLAALRFDYRGMGDGSGALRNFESVSADISSAIDALITAAPSVRRVVLVGLCDAASAALLYADEKPDDDRVAGLVLLNPWVRSDRTLAQTHVKHYYWRRLREPDFWRKLLSGRVATRAARDLAGNLSLALRRKRPAVGAAAPFQTRMARGWRGFRGTIWLALSGDDYTATEFRDVWTTDPVWSGLAERTNVRSLDLPRADHTLSVATDRRRFEEWCGSELLAFSRSLG